MPSGTSLDKTVSIDKFFQSNEEDLHQARLSSVSCVLVFK